jgi:glycosyltransferase involved in cell wall biosynthesis
MTTDDLSRRGWFANPAMYGKLARFLGEARNFQKWAYTPVDSVGPDGSTLGIEQATCAAGYDRVLAASEWGRDALVRSGRTDADFMPHGLFMPPFQPQKNPRPTLGWGAEDIRVGCLMANQSRKDWPAAFECAAVLKREYGNKFRFWCHVDLMIRYWNLYALASDYGVSDCIEVTTDLNDEQLAQRYSACDCTILPSGVRNSLHRNRLCRWAGTGYGGLPSHSGDLPRGHAV